MKWHERLGFARRRTLTIVVCCWLAVFVAVWNHVFDTMIVNAGREYVYHQQLFQRKRGPAVTIEQIMGPAQGAAIRTATGYGLTVAGLGLGLTLYVTARLAARRRGRAPTSPVSSPTGPR